ncbi:MAG: hypothetical protein NT074_03110 [Methanomicrobiales archaeon]|nr:hypothetical protein [Methanomicrobiales archaeon]
MCQQWGLATIQPPPIILSVPFVPTPVTGDEADHLAYDIEATGLQRSGYRPVCLEVLSWISARGTLSSAYPR